MSKQTTPSPQGEGRGGGFPSIFFACVPLALLVALIACVVAVFGDEALGGACQVALILGTSVCLVVGFLKHLITWEDFEKAICEKIGSLGPTIILLLLIGALGGSWMVSGVVPTLIYYGMEVMNPQWFLLSSCLICALVSVMTGSSWTTVATIGIALMGIGKAMGFSDGWIAGAILSGAYFGDKMSPLSDTTVLASSTVGTPLFTHIRYMLYTTVPTFLLTLTIFSVKGFNHAAVEVTQITAVQEALSHTFHISLWLLLVPIATMLMIANRLPAMVVLFLATLLAAITATFAQPELVGQIAGDSYEGVASHFRGTMMLVSGKTSLDTGVPELNDLVATRGMGGMMSTIWLIICATVFAAAMTATRMINSIMRALLHLVRGTTSMVGTTAATGVLFNLICADQYLSIILTSSMFQSLYAQRGYEPRLLSRSIEDSSTVTSVLIPWNTCGMTQSSVLGVSTLVYAPYCFFCYLSPIMTTLMAALGYKIKRHVAAKE